MKTESPMFSQNGMCVHKFVPHKDVTQTLLTLSLLAMILP